MADALDRGHKGGVDIKKIAVTRKDVTIKIHSRTGADLEVLRVEQKKAIFEEVFRRRLTVSQ